MYKTRDKVGLSALREVKLIIVSLLHEMKLVICNEIRRVFVHRKGDKETNMKKQILKKFSCILYLCNIKKKKKVLLVRFSYTSIFSIIFKLHVFGYKNGLVLRILEYLKIQYFLSTFA